MRSYDNINIHLIFHSIQIGTILLFFHYWFCIKVSAVNNYYLYNNSVENIVLIGSDIKVNISQSGTGTKIDSQHILPNTY